MKVLPLRPDLEKYIKQHNLIKKSEKALCLFEANIKHPSLNTELLEPHWRGIYSFRIDKQFRALFFITKDNCAEIFSITNHYKK